MNYELVWEEDVIKDFKKFEITEDEFNYIESKLNKKRINDFPFRVTKKLKGINAEIRTFKIDIKNVPFRIFFYINETTRTIYGLAISPRKNCYNKESLNKIIQQVRAIKK